MREDRLVEQMHRRLCGGSGGHPQSHPSLLGDIGGHDECQVAPDRFVVRTCGLCLGLVFVVCICLVARARCAIENVTVLPP